MDYTRLPRWRGFNLTEMFSVPDYCTDFVERDFAWMRAWGFDYVRLPMSYRCWTHDPLRWTEVDESRLRRVDQAVAWGRAYGLHVCINLHRAPGWSVNTFQTEPFDLWTDDTALDACAWQWRMLAERYRDVPTQALSFNFLNEPIHQTAVELRRVYARLCAEVRAVSPDRLIVLDGPRWARLPVPELADLHAAQSYHAYDPIQVCFWNWSQLPDAAKWPRPTWPMDVVSEDPFWHGRWDAGRLERQCLSSWDALAAAGVGVHVSEVACYKETPHEVMLAWYRDFLRAWKRRGWGWALWNLRGDFGVVDSGRSDVAYEDLDGHRLDRRLLELLRSDGA